MSCTIVVENLPRARLAQSVERQPFKLVVVGSSPTVGVLFVACIFFFQKILDIFFLSFHNSMGNRVLWPNG